MPRRAVADIVRTVQHRPVAAEPAISWAFPIRPDPLQTSDLATSYVSRGTPICATAVRRVRDVYPVERRDRRVAEGPNIVQNWDHGDLSLTSRWKGEEEAFSRDEQESND